MPQNGGSSEYSNIIGSLSETSTKIDDVSDLLETQFSKKLEQGDVEEVAQEDQKVGGAITAIAATASAIAPAFLQPSLLDDLAVGAAKLMQSLGSARLAIPTITAGGMGGIVAGIKAVGAVIAGMAGTIVGTILCTVAGLKIAYDMQAANIERDNQIRQLQLDFSALQTQQTRTTQKVTRVERGLTQVETVANTALITASEALNEVSNLEELIKANHEETKKDLKDLNDLSIAEFGNISSNFEQTFEWQYNNRSQATATLTRAAIERPDGMADKTSKQLNEATQGIPTIAQEDSNYQAEIAAGTAIAAGTLGYAGWKNKQAIQGGISGINAALNNGFNELKNQGKKLGALINLGQILQVVTLIATIHNALILSRDIGQTLFSVVDNGLNAALNALGIKDVDDEGVNTDKAFKDFLNSLGRSVFGAATWAQIQSSWAAANRITASANTLLWSVRDLGDTTSSMAEMAAENSGKIGNLLRRSGVTQDVGRWFPENYSRETVFQQKMRESLENVQNVAEAFESITSSVLSTQQTIQEINKNNQDFIKTLETEAPKIRVDNGPVRKAAAEAAEASYGPNITEADTKQSTGEEDATTS